MILSEAAYATARLVVDTPRVLRHDDVTPLRVPGQVEADPSRVALITPRVNGRLERLAGAVGQQVEAGQTVAWLLSPDFLTAQADLLQAARRYRALAASADSTTALRVLEAARTRLRLVGLAPDLAARVEATGEALELLPVTAPFEGSLVEALAIPGAALSPGTPIFRLIDLAEVDVVGHVPEAELPWVSVAQSATIHPTAYPSIRFPGRVERINAELDPSTRTVAAVIHVANPRGTLKPGMFAEVELAVPLARRANTAGRLVLPESAVMVQGQEHYVFVEVGTRTYERRAVGVLNLDEVGATTRRVLIRSGLQPSDRVVIAGTFTLKSELAKGGLEEH